MKSLIMILLFVCNVNSDIPLEVKWNNDLYLTPAYFTIKDSLSNNQLASICTGINLVYSYNGSFRPRAYSFMNTKQSVIKAGLTGSKLQEVLQHEKIHFDITEYITRSLNSKLLYVSDIHVANKLHGQYQKILDDWQKKYDEETDHYNNKYMQDVWNVKMKNLLSISQEYVNY